MNETDKKLCEIFRRILLSDNIELRDMVVTYIAIIDYIEAVDILSEYINTESLAWLREYTSKVIEHLEKLRDGFPSNPPLLSEMEDTTIGIKKKRK